MARRRKPRSDADPPRKGKGGRKRRIVFSGERNRASPAPIIKLYPSLNGDQRTAIVQMGQGSFLDIKCEQLHNPLVIWFAKCYRPARRAFVIPCRGVIPLTEESVHLMTGLPRGPLAVKYYTDFNLEALIAERLFPGETSRPKVSDLGTKIAAYNGANNTFKELWMMYVMSTVIAPTMDTKISNKCYPMLVDVESAEEMNLCKFIADDLHDNLSKGKYRRGCLLYCMEIDDYDHAKCREGLA